MRISVGLLWQSESHVLPANYTLAKGQLLSLEDNIPEIKSRYNQTIVSGLENGYVQTLSQSETEKSKTEQKWYLSHRPAQNPHVPKKLGRVCNAASKFDPSVSQ